MVAVPDAFYKMIIRESNDPKKPHVLAFIYPHAIKQSNNRKQRSPKEYPHKKFLVSIDEIEKHTGLDFFTNLSDAEQQAIEANPSATMWDDPGEYKLPD